MLKIVAIGNLTNDVELKIHHSGWITCPRFRGR